VTCIRRSLPVAVAATIACHAPSEPAKLNARRASLLSADSALARATSTQGIVRGFITGFADSAIYEQTGEPIIIGRANILATLTRLFSAPGYSLTWAPLFADVSAAGDVGYTYGAARQTNPTSDTVLGPGEKPLLYIAFWRREGNAWRVEAFMTSVSKDTPTAPTGPYATPTRDTSPAYPSAGAPADRASVLQADRAFADLSVRTGQDSSFTTYADTFGVQTGRDFVYGRAAIRGFYAGRTVDQVLRWSPTFADVSASNDLAFTAGPYVFTGKKTFHGGYLSIWRRQPDGGWRYVQDGGSWTGPGAIALSNTADAKVAIRVH
jgi:ketosteroid isomerase-like protein